MTYALLLCCVLGAAAAAGYALGAVLAAAAALRAEALPARWAFRLRAAPAAAGLLASVGLALPAFLLHEPAATRERPGLTALTLAAAGAALLARTLGAGLASWRSSVGASRAWRRRAEPVALPGAPAPAFRIHDPFPVVAVVGVMRPRLYVASQVIDALTPAELAAVLAHEAGHLAARDNLRRLLLRFLPSTGWTRLARRLERRWEAAAEVDADRCAGAAALDLASALIKAARLVPPGARLAVPAPAFHAGEGVAGRIRGLIEGAPASVPASCGRGLAALWTALGGASAALLPLLWRPLHALSEALVQLP